MTTMKLFLLTAISSILLMTGCGHQTPPTEKVVVIPPCDCTPDIAEITATPQRVTSGNWEFQIRIFAVGCTPDVSEIPDQSRLLVQKEITQLVEQHGLSFFQQSTQRAILEKHLPKIQAHAGGRAISRLHIIAVRSAESW